MIRIVSIGTKIKQIHGLTDSDLNDWEAGYIESIWEKTHCGMFTDRLSDKQIESVERIWEKHFA